jgi:hypothetical protein
MSFRSVISLVLIFLCCTSTALAEFKKVGSARIDAVRSSDIARSCSYRLRGALTATRSNTYELGYVKEEVSTTNPPTFSYVLEGGISYPLLLELNTLNPSVYVSTKPTPSSTPMVNMAEQIRVEIFPSANATIKVISRGTPYALRPSYFDLEAECGAHAYIPTSGTGSHALCPGLTFYTFDWTVPPPVTQKTCVCPFNSTTSGMVTPCSALPTEPGRTIQLCENGQFAWPGSPQPTCYSGSKQLGPVATWFQNSYIFDHATCSCKLCDPIYTSRSADASSCRCLHTTMQGLLNHVTSAPPVSPPVNGDACLNRVNWVWVPRNGVIFDPSICGCKSCPQGKTPNADRSACI